MPSGLLPAGRMDGSSRSLRRWLRMFQRAVTGVFYYYYYFPFSSSKSSLCFFLAPDPSSRSDSQCEKAAAFPEMFVYGEEKAWQRLGWSGDAQPCPSLRDIRPWLLTEARDAAQQPAFSWHPAWSAAFSPLLQSRGCGSPGSRCSFVLRGFIPCRRKWPSSPALGQDCCWWWGAGAWGAPFKIGHGRDARTFFFCYHPRFEGVHLQWGLE